MSDNENKLFIQTKSNLYQEESLNSVNIQHCNVRVKEISQTNKH